MEGGILFIDKEAGLTSRKVDNLIGHLFRTKKVGHLGTLDPFATGLLICAVNSATKALRFIPDEEKEYEAVLVLGKKTSTADLLGIEVETKPVPELTLEQVREAVSSLKEEKSQIPPMTSAIKIDGKALYKLAHKGEEISRKPRPIEVHSAALLAFADNKITFRVVVSKGTYIRTLGETLAEKLGTVGYLSALRRSAVGPYRVEQAKQLNKITAASLLSPLCVLEHIKRIELGDEEAFKARNGVKLHFDVEEEQILLVYHQTPVAVYEKEVDNVYRCLRGLE